MDTVANKIKEYEILRGEIEQKIELHNTLTTFTITTVVAILSFVLLQEPPYSAFLFLMPFCVLIPMSMRIAYYRAAMAKISAYMIVYLEEDIPGICWETRNQKIGSMAIEDKSVVKVGKKRTRPFLGSTKTRSLLLSRYYECLVLGILCYILYAIHYCQNKELCIVTLINLGWPLLLIILEVLITIAMGSVRGSKIFWIEKWKMLKTSEENSCINSDKENENV